jgi:hypothetical protein
VPKTDSTPPTGKRSFALLGYLSELDARQRFEEFKANDSDNFDLIELPEYLTILE